MKYYIYISDAKVDMLLPQIPHPAVKKISSELGFDVKLLKGSRKSEETIDENRISRLETVVSFIREYGNLGSINEPEEYFAGSMPSRLAPIQEKGPGIMYFTGRTDTTLVGLAGSLKHMITRAGDSQLHLGGSDSWYIFDYLQSVVYESNLFFDDEPDKEDILRGAVELARGMPGPQQNLEFMAKRLQWAALDRERQAAWKLEGISCVLLGTPLYIAMAG